MNRGSDPFLFRQIQVLIVDDNQFVRKLIRSMLRQLGIQEIHEATDGLEAVEAIAARDCNLVLLDWRMPGFTGEEFLEMIRRSPEPRLQSLPVIVLSAFTSYSMVVRAASAGANAVVVKPLSITILGRRIEKVMREAFGLYAPQPVHVPISAAPVTHDLGELLATEKEDADEGLEVYSI